MLRFVLTDRCARMHSFTFPLVQIGKRNKNSLMWRGSVMPFFLISVLMQRVFYSVMLLFLVLKCGIEQVSSGDWSSFRQHSWFLNIGARLTNSIHVKGFLPNFVKSSSSAGFSLLVIRCNVVCGTSKVLDAKSIPISPFLTAALTFPMFLFHSPFFSIFGIHFAGNMVHYIILASHWYTILPVFFTITLFTNIFI